MNTKSCKICKERYPITEFYKSSAYKDGYAPSCKLCILKYDRERILKHPGPRTTGTKICTSCRLEKPVQDYSKRLRSRDGLRNRCKICDRLAEKKYRQNNPSQSYLAKIRQKYGLDKHSYLELLKKQDNKCKICKEIKQLVVDHCHTSLKIRGLLCFNCNAALGMLQDDVEYLRNAIEYLKENNELDKST